MVRRMQVLVIHRAHTSLHHLSHSVGLTAVLSPLLSLAAEG